MPTNWFSIKPLKVKLLAGEQKATTCFVAHIYFVAVTLKAEATGGARRPLPSED